MLKTKFDMFMPHRVVVYLRMSSEGQNPRSPDQQLATIQETMRRLGVRWEIVKIYRDDAISGRYSRKRPRYQRMLKDLKSGRVQATLVLVDTFERLTRDKDGDAIRARLKKSGALVLTANSNFADPTTTAGRALSMVESIRASEDGEIKAHNVLRGKLDAVRLRHWPGGPIPFGFRLRAVFATVNGAQTFSHNELEPNPITRWIVEEMFRLADEFGFGQTRIAETLNNDPRIADELKPFHPSTVGQILDGILYYGDYVWNQNCTGIVDDVRVVEPLPESEWEWATNFCEGIVSREVWDRVQVVRDARRKPKATQDPDNALADPRMIGLNVEGLALKYPLSGLVACASCLRRMIAQSTKPYITVAGEERRYVAYACPGVQGGLCTNRSRIPEGWLREVVMTLVRERLGLNGDLSAATPELLRFIELVRQEWAGLEAAQPDPSAAFLVEKRDLEERCRGWLQTLGNPSLSPIVRNGVEGELEKAQVRIRQIEADRLSRASGEQVRDQALNPQLILERLQQFGTIINGSNPTAMNVLLSHHIDTIWVDKDEVVTVRTCRLGVLASDLGLFANTGCAQQSPPGSAEPSRFTATPRRRGRLNTAGAIEDDDEAEAANDFASDTNRFAGLGEQWFCDDRFTVPETLSWAKANAVAVAEYRLSTCATMEVTAKHFGKTSPTIRSALRHAKAEFGISALGKSVSRPTLPNWSRANAVTVAQFMNQPGATMMEATVRFGKSEPTIRKALEFASAARADDASANRCDLASGTQPGDGP